MTNPSTTSSSTTTDLSVFSTILAAAADEAPVVTPEAPAPAFVFDGTRQAPSDDFVLPVAPATKTLYGYQAAAVETILGKRRAVLGYEPGLGKTAIMQAVAAAAVADGGRALCIVPPSLTYSPWVQDFAADYPHLRVAVVKGRKAEAFPDADVVVISDSVIAKRVLAPCAGEGKCDEPTCDHLSDVARWAPAAVFVDEAHRCKNRGSERTKGVIALADALPADAIVVLATGTLVANHATDAWAPIRATGTANATAVSGGHTWRAFIGSWCDVKNVKTRRGTYVPVPVGLTDAEALRERLVTTCMISVPRSEVVDLPERTTVTRSLDLGSAAAQYRRIEREFLAWVRETKGDAAFIRAARGEAIVRLMTLWQQDGLAKVGETVAYVDSLIEESEAGEQVVVFAHHSAVTAALYEGFLAKGYRVAAIVGGMSARAKAEVVADFQDGQYDVLIGQHQAAGVGLTLTASRHVVWAQLPWAPGTFVQGSDRVFRIGQQRSVVTHVLNGAGLVSERLWDVLTAKGQVADTINVGGVANFDEPDVIAAVLASYGYGD